MTSGKADRHARTVSLSPSSQCIHPCQAWISSLSVARSHAGIATTGGANSVLQDQEGGDEGEVPGRTHRKRATEEGEGEEGEDETREDSDKACHHLPELAIRCTQLQP